MDYGWFGSLALWIPWPVKRGMEGRRQDRGSSCLGRSKVGVLVSSHPNKRVREVDQDLTTLMCGLSCGLFSFEKMPG